MLKRKSSENPGWKKIKSRDEAEFLPLIEELSDYENLSFDDAKLTLKKQNLAAESSQKACHKKKGLKPKKHTLRLSNSIRTQSDASTSTPFTKAGVCVSRPVSSNYLLKDPCWLAYGFGSATLEAISKLGFSSVTKIQEETLKIALEGRDIVASAETVFLSCITLRDLEKLLRIYYPLSTIF